MKGDTYERGDVVEHEDHGTVRIVDLSRRVEAIGRDTDDLATIVTFTTEVDSRTYPGHTEHEEEKDSFLRSITDA